MPRRIIQWVAGAALTVLFLTACRSTTVEIAGGELRNRTSEPILEVCAAHQPTGRVVSVSQILPGTAFLLEIPPREMLSSHVTLTWTTLRGSSCERTLEITPPPEELRAEPCWIVYSIVGPGRASLSWERPPSSPAEAGDDRR